MTDLSIVLPEFATQRYARLIPSLEKNLVTTTDLITLDAVDIAKRAQLPLLEVQRLCSAVLQVLQCDLGIGQAINTGNRSEHGSSALRKTGDKVIKSWDTIGTLDEDVDNALGGGIPTGYITEVTGERWVWMGYCLFISDGHQWRWQDTIPSRSSTCNPATSTPWPFSVRTVYLYRISPTYESTFADVIDASYFGIR
jgi:DNA repair protein RAD57